MKKYLLRLQAILLAVLLFLQPLCALAEEQEELEPVTHVGTATVALKVRRRPDRTSGGCDSIPRGSFVYILDYGNVWCKVRTDSAEGYILTEYLTDVKAQDGVEVAKPEEPKQPVGELMAGFTTNESNFYEGYYAHMIRRDYIYERPDVNSARVRVVPIYEQLVVSEIVGDWALVRYKGKYCGYMQVDSLFKWDRIDPYIGEIPGLEIWPYMVFVNHSTTVYDWKTNKPLQTINPGSALCVGEPDAMGRYLVPYERVDGYIMEEDITWKIPVVDWQEAKSGDLISVMTTFYAVGISTLEYQGRNWNIRLASDYISGTILQPGQYYNQNHTIGPYRKSTGYKEAPIMSKYANSGYGGGTCQVNTTFYIATVQLPLLVTHRRVHADVGIYYAEQGFDAAVGGGAINLEMYNTLPYAIRYQAFISDGVLTICIFKV